MAGIVNKKEPVDELPQRNLRVVIPSASSNNVTAQSTHVTNNNHARNSGGDEVNYSSTQYMNKIRGIVVNFGAKAFVS